MHIHLMPRLGLSGDIIFLFLLPLIIIIIFFFASSSSSSSTRVHCGPWLLIQFPSNPPDLQPLYANLLFPFLQIFFNLKSSSFLWSSSSPYSFYSDSHYLFWYSFAIHPLYMPKPSYSKQFLLLFVFLTYTVKLYLQLLPTSTYK